jgi:hypothetical protein
MMRIDCFSDERVMSVENGLFQTLSLRQGWPEEDTGSCDAKGGEEKNKDQ